MLFFDLEFSNFQSEWVQNELIYWVFLAALQIFSNNPNFLLLFRFPRWFGQDLYAGEGQAGLLKIVLKGLGVQLSDKDEEADQISVIIKIATVTVLLMLLVIMICWVISRVSPRLRICFYPPSLAHPANVFEEILRRAQSFRSYSPRRQVINFDYLFVKYFNFIILNKVFFLLIWVNSKSRLWRGKEWGGTKE